VRVVCEGDDGDEQEVGGRASVDADAATVADEPAAGAAYWAHQQQRYLRHWTENLPVSFIIIIIIIINEYD